MEKELKIEDVNNLWESFYEFLKTKNFEEEYNKLLDSRPMLSIEKDAEYTGLVIDALFEFLTLNGYTTLNPLVISFIIQFDRGYYEKMAETFKHCYR